jgi:hypothetical protein
MMRMGCLSFYATAVNQAFAELNKMEEEQTEETEE